MRYDPTFNPARTYYYAQDHEGSVTHLLNTSGNVVESYKYDAFGLPTIYDGNGTQISSSAFSNRFLFTGREYANLFGFYEYRSRAYHPGLGRFMSEDPKLFVRRAALGAAPADWTFAAHPDEGEVNLFRYCGNDAIDFADPMGTDAIMLVQPNTAVTFGHVALLAGNNKTGWYFFEKQGGPDGNHNNRALQFKTLDTFRESRLGNNYQYAWRASSDARQDAAMIKAGIANYNKAYYVARENCADLTHDILAAGDLGVSKQKILGITVPNILAQHFVNDRDARDARADVRAPDASRTDEEARRRGELQAKEMSGQMQHGGSPRHGE
jgi:RHS repeat-associated protein